MAGYFHAVIFHLPLLDCLRNVSDRCSWLSKKIPKPFLLAKVWLHPSRPDCSSKWAAHFDCICTNKRLWPPQVNFWLAGAGQGEPRGGSDSEKIKFEVLPQASGSPGHSLQVEVVYSDVFFLFVPSGECLGQNRHSNNHRAPKGSEYFETANGFYVQNISPH